MVVLVASVDDHAVEPWLLVTVSQGGAADYSDLREAVARAKTGATIRILDAGRYEGPIVLSGSRRPNKLTIDSPQGATLFAAATVVAALEIQNKPNITVRRLKIECANDQHGIVLYRDVSGTILEKIAIDQPASSRTAAVYLTSGTHGRPTPPCD